MVRADAGQVILLPGAPFASRLFPPGLKKEAGATAPASADFLDINSVGCWPRCGQSKSGHTKSAGFPASMVDCKATFGHGLSNWHTFTLKIFRGKPMQ
jgi:hypothetical protein